VHTALSRLSRDEALCGLSEKKRNISLICSEICDPDSYWDCVLSGKTKHVAGLL